MTKSNSNFYCECGKFIIRPTKKPHCRRCLKLIKLGKPITLRKSSTTTPFMFTEGIVSSSQLWEIKSLLLLIKYKRFTHTDILRLLSIYCILNYEQEGSTAKSDEMDGDGVSIQITKMIDQFRKLIECNRSEK